jgi:hypothetical protein
MRKSERLGRHGEYIVCAYLSLFSDTVFVVPHSASSDVVAEFDDVLLKFQVKAVSNQRMHYPKNGKKYRSGWNIDMRKSGNTIDREYKTKQIDIFCLYIVPLNKLIFIEANTGQHHYTFNDDSVAEINTEETLKKTVQQALNRLKKV